MRKEANVKIMIRVFFYLILTNSLVADSNFASSADTPQIFQNWGSVIESSGSKFFRSTVSDMHLNRGYNNRHPWLREELLYVQSNSRLLICQNPKGQLRYLALPTQVYPIPTAPGEDSLGLRYLQGTFYNFDLIRLTDIHYQIQLEDDDRPSDLVTANRPNESFYSQQFLPLTSALFQDLKVTICSFAPMAADRHSAALSPAPLPGPPGAFYLLHLKNQGNQAVKGTVLLKCRNALNRRKSEKTVTNNTLVLTTLDGSVGIHMNDSSWQQEDDWHVAKRNVNILPGENILITTRIVLEERYGDIIPRIHELFLHSPLEWLNYTANFWAERLGRLEVSAFDFPREVEMSRDIYVRCVIDNFCCIQTDAEGNILSFYQGAAKGGTIWAIDYEPTIVSINSLCPELARQGILFTMHRNRPPRSPYKSEHSVSILVSPLLIARKWLEVSGDISFFQEREDVMIALSSIIGDLEEMKAQDHMLFPSRFSSDGEVGRRYDLGTNIKAWFAFDSYAYILKSLGWKNEAQSYRRTAAKIREAINNTMVIDGPFGPQFSGGTNLSEDPESFYLSENIPYYDGEDTGTHLAPIYGVFEFRVKPWVNYHRFARSMFCPNYEPEFGALRWFPSGRCPSLDGTGFVSRLAGSMNRREMKKSLHLLYENACDETGSVFWWPIGRNFKRGLTRCSQGQGTWAWQYLEQWLGIKIDALSQILRIAPQGLITDFEWKGYRAGAYRFDILWKEEKTGTVLKVRNLNLEVWKIEVGIRPFGSGVEAELIWKDVEVRPGEQISVLFNNPGKSPQEYQYENIVAETEAEHLSEDGIVFMWYGPVDPHIKSFDLWKDEHLDVRFYVLNASDSDWIDAAVTLMYPDGWLGEARKPGYWLKPENRVANQTSLQLGKVLPMQSRVAPFRMKGPHTYDVIHLGKDKSPHFPSETGDTIKLPTREIRTEMEIHFEAVLTARKSDGGRIEKRLILPVRIIPITED